MAATTSSIAILMKEKKGQSSTKKERQQGEPPWEIKVEKGELVIEIPEKERAQGVEDPPNYRLYSNPEVSLYAPGFEVAPLKDNELNYLIAVAPASLRIREYIREDKMKMAMGLIVGDVVMFKMKVLPDGPEQIVTGVIRYIGPVPQRAEGTFFGIEILEKKFRGRGYSSGRPYFDCGMNNGVFVSMDKIVQKSRQQLLPSDISRITSQPTLADNTLVNTKSQGTLQMVTEIDYLTPRVANPVFTSKLPQEQESQFKPGDRIVLQSVKGDVIPGTVRWVGTTRVSKDFNASPIPVVGIEIDKMITLDKHFPDLYVHMPSNYGQKLFKVPFNHTRVFLPEQLVVHADQFEKEQEKETLDKEEQEIAQRYGIDMKEQQALLDKANLEKCAAYNIRLTREQFQDPPIGTEDRGDSEEEQGVAGAGSVGVKNNMDPSMCLVQEDRPVNEGLLEGRIEQERIALQKLKRKHEQQKRDQGGRDPSHDYQGIDGGKEHIVEDSYVNIAPYDVSQQGDAGGCGYPSSDLSRVKEDQRWNSASDPPHRRSPHPHHTPYNDHPSGPTSLPSIPTSVPLPHHLPPSTATAVPPQFSIGSMVCVPRQRGTPLHGVIRWIGTLPDFPGMIAGVELEEDLNSCTDGTWQGRRFFECQPRRGYFCPVTSLELDTTFLDDGQDDGRNTRDDSELNKLINQLQIDKKSVEEKKKSLEKLNEQITSENQSLKREKEQWSTEKEQLQREHYQLKEEKLQLYKEKRQLEEVNYYLQQDKRQLEQDKWQLEREYHQLQEDHHRITDQYTNLSTAHTNLQREMREKDNVHSQIQTRRAQLEIETMRLKGQVRQLEESSVSDIKYWEVSYEQVTTNGVELGRGGWGKVLVGLVNGQKVAIKMLHSDIVSPHYNQLVRREITMMAKVRHPNLILFMGGVLDHPSGAPIIITELLDTSLRKAYKDGLVRNDDVKLSILRDVAAALNYLHCHRERIIHRDVSSANVLLESKGHGNYWRGKLSDFGSANLVQYSMTTGPGAVPYTAPEVPQAQTTKMDVYSYGVLLCEVMTGQFPFRESFPSMLQSLSNIQWIYTLVIDCTKHTRTDRPDMSHVLCVFDEQYDDGEMKINITEFKPLPL